MGSTSTRVVRLPVLLGIAIAGFAVVAFIGLNADAQATQCDGTSHGSGKLLRAKTCPGTSPPSAGMYRIGGWVEGNNLVTSFGVNLPFNAASPPTGPVVGYNPTIGIGTSGAGGGSAGTCYFNDVAWSGPNPQSQSGLWRQAACGNLGTNAAVYTYRWPSYKAAAASNPPYYCNEMDVIYPLSSLGAAMGTTIQFGPIVGDPNGGGIFYAISTYNSAATVLDSFLYQKTTMVAGEAFNLVPSMPTLTGVISGQTVTLTMTRAGDNNVERSFGFYLREGATILNGGNPITGNGGLYVPPGSSGFWPGGYTSYTFTLTGVSLGSHTYTLTEANCRGESPQASTTVNVTAPPGPPACSPATQTAVTGQTVTLTATGGDGTYAWSGGGVPASGSTSSFSTAYSTAGPKTITLTSASQSTTCSITVNLPAPPACSPATQTAVTGQTVTLTATGGDGTYAWSGGGVPASGSTSSFSTAYSTAGPKTITLTSASQSTTCSITVNLPGSPACLPASQTVPVGTPATVTASGGDGVFGWTGGGDPATGTEASFATTFGTAGTYVVVVTSASQTVSCEVIASDGGLCSGLQAKFYFTNGPIETGDPVSFTDASTYSGATTKSWAWDFGDGHTSTIQSLTHSFAAAGTYVVRLVVVDSNDCVAVYESSVRVESPGVPAAPNEESADSPPAVTPPVVFAGEDIVVREGDSVKLVPSATGPRSPFTFTWRQVSGPNIAFVGAGEAEPEFVAPALADPAVPARLIFAVYASDGAADSEEDSVQVTIVAKNQQAPVANAGPDVTIQKGGTVVLDGSASSDPDGDALTFSWAHAGGAPVATLTGTGATAAVTAPVDAPGGFIDIELTVDDGAFRSADTVRIWLESPPQILTGFQATTLEDGSVLFVANAASTEYAWDFGDGETLRTADATASHVYTSPGTYDVQLRLASDAEPVSQQVTPTVPAAQYSAPVRPVESNSMPWLVIAASAGVVLTAGMFALAIRHRKGK